MTRISVTSFVLASIGFLALPLASHAQTPATPDPNAPQVTDQRSFSVDGRLLGLSPDGRFLAAYDEEAETLCSYETADPTQSHACADLAAAGVSSIYVDDARWSPDGTRLAFNEPGPVYFVDADIWVFDADSGDLLNLTDDGVDGGLSIFDSEDQDPFFMDILPAWSPDGTEIAFARTGWRSETWYGTHMMRVPADGSGDATEIVEVVPDQPMVVYFGCAWSPDGRTLYYSVAKPQSDDPDNGIWAVDVASGQAEQLAGTEDPEKGYPTVQSVSARGDLVLVDYPRVLSDFVVGGSPFGLLDVATGEVASLDILSAGPDDFAFPGAATFSPDGEWLIYNERGTDSATELYLRQVDSSDETLLLGSIEEEPTPVFSLVWATDGTVLVQDFPNSGQLLTVEGGNTPPPPTEPAATPASTPIDPATPAAGSGPVDPSAVAAGTQLVVNDAVATLRSSPSPDAPVAGQVEQGTTLTAIGPPVEGGGYTWIPVTDDASGTIGYIRAEFVSATDS